MGYFLQLAASVLLYASFRTVYATTFDAPVVEHCLGHMSMGWCNDPVVKNWLEQYVA